MARYSIPAYAYGGRMPAVLGTVVHDAECPLEAGYAVSLAKHWFGTAKAGTSARGFVDPRDIVDMADRRTTTYHCGPRGNGFFIGWEQAGYARLSRGEWLSPAGRAQMRQLAQVIREDHAALGLPLTIVTNPDVVRAKVARREPIGVVYHDTIRRALGGTTHTDPTPNYPTDELQNLLLAQAAAAPVAAAPVILEDDDMIMISAPNRGVAVIGPNYFLSLPSNEYVEQARAIVTKVVEGNDRQFDIWRSTATAGDSGDNDDVRGMLEQLAKTAK